MPQELTVRDYLALVRRHAWLVALCTVGVIGAALIYSALQTPLYRSTARILINQTTANDIFDPVSGTPQSLADRVARNEVELLRSQLVRSEAVERLGFPAGISANAETRADVVTVTSVHRDPARAQQIAQVFAESYIDVRRDEFVGDRLATAEKLLERIAQVDADIVAQAGSDTSRLEKLRSDLANSYDRLTITADLGNNGSARVINDAPLPRAPFSPRTQRNVGLGGIVGLVFGFGLAVLLESLDNSIKDQRVLDQLGKGVPAIVSIPRLTSETGGVVALSNPDGVDTEVFRSLRASLEFLAVDETVQVIQVTSPGPSAGKTTIAANLAVVLAQAGQRVAIVDADLRRPRVHSAFERPQVPGLTSIIIGRSKPSEASHAMRLNNGALWVVPSGPVPPGPSELLGSERAQRAFDALRKAVDIVIVDSAPVLPVSDALVLSRHIDATLVVASAKRTKRDDLVRALERLDQAGANVIGTVLNEVKTRNNLSYGYGYGYGYGAAQPDGGFFGRRKSAAPRIEGTEMLDDAELPRFEAAKSKPNGAPAKRSAGQAEPRVPASEWQDDMSVDAGS